jgi:hypothetical protein
MRLGTFFPDVLPDLKLVEPVNQPGAQQQAEQKCGEAGHGRSKCDVAKYIQGPE